MAVSLGPVPLIDVALGGAVLLAVLVAVRRGRRTVAVLVTLTLAMAVAWLLVGVLALLEGPLGQAARESVLLRVLPSPLEALRRLTS